MVAENFVICWPQMARNLRKLSLDFGPSNPLEIAFSAGLRLRRRKKTLKDIQTYSMWDRVSTTFLVTKIKTISRLPRLKRLKSQFNCPPWLEKILKYTSFRWLEIHFNCPPWLEKCLKYAGLKWLEIHLSCHKNQDNIKITKTEKAKKSV